jgi:hypothetical protein
MNQFNKTLFEYEKYCQVITEILLWVPIDVIYLCCDYLYFRNYINKHVLENISEKLIPNGVALQTFVQLGTNEDHTKLRISNRTCFWEITDPKIFEIRTRKTASSFAIHLRRSSILIRYRNGSNEIYKKSIMRQPIFFYSESDFDDFCLDKYFIYTRGTQIEHSTPRILLYLATPPYHYFSTFHFSGDLIVFDCDEEHDLFYACNAVSSQTNNQFSTSHTIFVYSVKNINYECQRTWTWLDHDSKNRMNIVRNLTILDSWMYLTYNFEIRIFPTSATSYSDLVQILFLKNSNHTNFFIGMPILIHNCLYILVQIERKYHLQIFS